MRWYIVFSAILTASMTPVRATAGVDEGGVMTDKAPWSGFWWPHKSGGLQRPAAKYDAATPQPTVDRWKAGTASATPGRHHQSPRKNPVGGKCPEG